MRNDVVAITAFTSNRENWFAATRRNTANTCDSARSRGPALELPRLSIYCDCDVLHVGLKWSLPAASTLSRERLMFTRMRDEVQPIAGECYERSERTSSPAVQACRWWSTTGIGRPRPTIGRNQTSFQESVQPVDACTCGPGRAKEEWSGHTHRPTLVRLGRQASAGRAHRRA